MGFYKQGERVTWRGINRDYTGVVDGFFGAFAVVRVDQSGKAVLLANETIKNNQNEKTGISPA